MQVLIISGFLGAGKTSFIKAMTRATGRQFVVVENEFGNSNVDSKLLNQDAMKIYELTEGCICCSMNMDFSLSVMTIANTLNPDYIIVEPSGVAMPSRILESLRKISYENIGILSPVVIVDSKNFISQKNFYPEYFNDQLNTAGTVVLSKSENLSRSEFDEIYNELGIKENINFYHEHYSKWPREKWLELLTNYISDSKKINPVEIPDAKLSSLALTNIKVSSPDELMYKLENLLTGNYGDIVRAKGFALTQNESINFSVVSGIYEITGANNNNSDSDIVIIGENLQTGKISELFNGEIIEEDD